MRKCSAEDLRDVLKAHRLVRAELKSKLTQPEHRAAQAASQVKRVSCLALGLPQWHPPSVLPVGKLSVTSGQLHSPGHLGASRLQRQEAAAQSAAAVGSTGKNETPGCSGGHLEGQMLHCSDKDGSAIVLMSGENEFKAALCHYFMCTSESVSIHQYTGDIPFYRNNRALFATRRLFLN